MSINLFSVGGFFVFWFSLELISWIQQKKYKKQLRRKALGLGGEVR